MDDILALTDEFLTLVVFFSFTYGLLISTLKGMTLGYLDRLNQGSGSEIDRLIRYPRGNGHGDMRPRQIPRGLCYY